ncbi:hypothetical protein BT93_J0764 [Corymbia citriodora subsp. variegata]|nr:hypothetical protein BT93_J0764 [Corymbia citriodora subsp. variegata]KAF8009878.1 hypothetical protein BT93_J0764 [Corymbia citriodora subsp. variegata]KAF8009879.1 hypothetical protein BT93_J0764 [Corymbia citriodora subsp. variegata]KAF8009880.1 hypothetical protein BT93_J0764 [Corymbia citriodora subsp. variegata]KAF8009882.1 hypothetical protein BT93_J0764 [Corymbia citriodora subsp. variegata]
MDQLPWPSSSTSPSSPSPPFSPPKAHSLSIGSEVWMMAEQRIEEILSAIQPTPFSEEKRMQVIEHVQRIIRGHYGTEVFAFGSVPLGTYIPDGDIDLTILCYNDEEEAFAAEICKFLENRERDPDFQIKDVLYINAQLKTVKFCMESIAVDVTFNQHAGLSSLCFLEQVDELMGKDHLFKRSVILIKAWCFYESRILGAHHGLVSTYGLEIMVLYIINLFHSSLDGPLGVLYRFLDYYSTFDWDTYCVSAYGPIAVSSLPILEEELPENDGGTLLLGKEFFRNCKAMFSGPTNAFETRAAGFPVKHLNILDPLKDNNNLGRSVNKANFYRMRCALAYGAQKLGEILMLPGERLLEGIESFFQNTLDRNGRGLRPDIELAVSAFGTGKIEVADLAGDFPSYYNNLVCSQWHYEHNLFADELNTPLSSQVQSNRTLDVLQRLPSRNRASLFRKGTDVFFPKPLNCYASTYGPSAALLETEENVNTRAKNPPNRATGPFTHHAMSHQFDRRVRQWTRPMSPGATAQDAEAKTSEMESQDQCLVMDGVKNCLNFTEIQMENEDTRETENCLDLSLEAFPLLPCREKSTAHTLKFGTIECPEPGYSGHFVGESSGSVPMTDVKEQPDSSLESMTLTQFVQCDNKDFPPLSR